MLRAAGPGQAGPAPGPPQQATAGLSAVSAAPGEAGVVTPGRLAEGANNASEGVSGWGMPEWSLSEKS